MTCEGLDRLGDDALLTHLASCAACAARASRDARVADALVAAVATRQRTALLVRRAGAAALAASLLLSVGLSVRSLRQPPPRVLYILRGDATGVVLTGPGVFRRSERVPRTAHSRKGDRT
jgi:hypothetical protein